MPEPRSPLWRSVRGSKAESRPASRPSLPCLPVLNRRSCVCTRLRPVRSMGKDGLWIGPSEGEVDPDRIVVATVAAEVTAASDAGAGEDAGRGRREPDLVEQLVVGRLVGGFESVGPGPAGRWRVA